MLRASSLIYTLMIALLISLILGSLLLVSHYQKVFQLKGYHEELARDNVQSAIRLFLATDEDGLGEYRGVLFDSPVDSFYVRSEAWGIYGLIHARATHAQAIAEKSCLFGAVTKGEMNAALFLKDQNFPLKLVGKTKLIGDCYLPKAGVTSGYIGRRTFEEKKFVDGEIISSRNRQPKLTFDHLITTRNSLVESINIPQQGQFMGLEKAEIQAAWTGETQTIFSEGKLLVDEMKIQGKCRVMSNEGIHISAKNELDNTLFFAPYIKVEKGFKGSIQLFATDSIIIESDVELKYPSAVVVSGANQGAAGFLRLEPYASVEGVVLNSPSFLGELNSNKSYSYISKDAVIKGQAYLQGQTELWGKVYGSLATDKFTLKTASATYGNHLLDATISREGINPEFVGGLFVEDVKRRKVLRWVE